MPTRTYHLGLRRGDLTQGATPRQQSTLYLEASRNLDSLSCELWIYLGERLTTKVHLRANLPGILAMVNRNEGTDFTRIVLDD